MSDSLFVELYAALHDTLPDEPAAAPTPTPNRTPTAMPGLSVKEPDPKRGWKLAEGRTFDEAVVARMRQRAQARGYHLDVKPLKFADGRTQHHITVYHPKGKRMANPQEFYAADEDEPVEPSKPSPYGSFENIGDLTKHLEQEHGEHLEQLHLSEPHGSAVYLHSIRMKPGHTGQGTGSKIVRAIQEYATAKDLPVVLEAEADPGRKAKLEAFYHAHGFKKPGRTRDYSLPQHTHIWRPRFGMTEDYTQDGEPDQYAARHIPSSPGQQGLFDQDQHPRGQPENAGEFKKKQATPPTRQETSRAKDLWMQGATMQNQKRGMNPRDAAHQAALDWQQQEEMEAEFDKQNPPVLGGKEAPAAQVSDAPPVPQATSPGTVHGVTGTLDDWHRAAQVEPVRGGYRVTVVMGKPPTASSFKVQASNERQAVAHAFKAHQNEIQGNQQTDQAGADFARKAREQQQAMRAMATGQNPSTPPLQNLGTSQQVPTNPDTRTPGDTPAPAPGTAAPSAGGRPTGETLTGPGGGDTPVNPFREKADQLQRQADALHGGTSHERAMANAFPLGTGVPGNASSHRTQRQSDKRIDASIDRAKRAIETSKRAAAMSLKADQFEQGMIDANGLPTPKAQEATQQAKQRQQGADATIADYLRATLKPGHTVYVNGNPIVVKRVNPKGITTDMGSRWSYNEIMPAGPDGEMSRKDFVAAIQARRNPSPEQHTALTSALLREYYAQRFADRVVERYAAKQEHPITEHEDEYGRYRQIGGAIDPSGNWKRFDAIPPEQHVVMYHATNRRAAQDILANGWNPETAAKASAFTDTPPDYVYMGGKGGLGSYIGHGGKGDPVLLAFRVQRQHLEPDAGTDWKSHVRQFRKDIVRHHGREAITNPTATHTYANINQVRAHHTRVEPIGILDPEGQTSTHPDGWKFKSKGEVLGGPEQYAQQARLFDDAGGSPRKEFDETKHQRAGGQFARKFPRVQSKEVQPALPGVDLLAQRRIVTKPQPVGQNAAPMHNTKIPETVQPVDAPPSRDKMLHRAGQYLADNWKTWWGGLDTPVPEPDDMEKEFAQHAGPTVTRQEANQILRNAGVGKHLPPETDLLAGTKSFQKHGDAIPSDHLLFHAVHAMMDQDRTNRRLAATEQAGDARALKFAKPGTDQHFVVHPAAHSGYRGQWQITRFDDRGPSGHQYHKTKEEAIGAAIGAHPNSYWDEGDSDYRLVEQYTLDKAKADLYTALWGAQQRLERLVSDQVTRGPSDLVSDQPDRYKATPEGPFTNEWHEWFGDSKIRNRHGHPLTVYHGTREDFDALDTSDRGFDDSLANQLGDNIGGFFTTRPSTANDFAQRGKKAGHRLTTHEINANQWPEGAAVVPAHLSIKNPKLFRTQEEWRAFLKQSQNARQALERAGHDGVVIRRAGYSKPDSKETWIVAFHPHQVKSIHNPRPTEDSRMMYAQDMVDAAPDHYTSKGENCNAKPTQTLPGTVQSRHSAPAGDQAQDQSGRAKTETRNQGRDPQRTGTTADHYGRGPVLTFAEALRDRYALRPDPRQTSLFDRPVTVETRGNQPGVTVQSSPNRPASAIANTGQLPDNLSAALPPPTSAILPPRHQARHSELLAKGFRRTPAEQQEFQDLQRRIEEMQDAQPQTYAQQLRDAILDRYHAQNHITDDTISEPYAQFQELVALATELDRYKAKDSPGQQHLFKEEDHPRAPEGAKGGHGGEFVEKKPEPERTSEPTHVRTDVQPGENEELVARLQGGDQEAFNQLLARNKPFIADRARKAGAREGRDLDDWIQEGSVILWTAAGKFNPELGHKFLTYLGTALDHRFTKLRQRDIGTKDKPKPRHLQGAVDDEGRPVHEPIASPDETPLAERELKQAVRTVVERLPNPRHRQILQLAYGLDGPPLTHAQIAEQLGVRPQAVQQQLARILPTLQRQLQDQYAARCLRDAMLERYHAITKAAPERYAQAMRSAYLDRYGWRDAAAGALTKAADWVKGTPPAERTDHTDHTRGNPPTEATRTQQRPGPARKSTEPVTAEIVKPAPRPPEPSPAAKAKQQALQTPAKPQGLPAQRPSETALGHMTVTRLHTPQLDAAHQALAGLHDYDRVQQEAHRIANEKSRFATGNLKSTSTAARREWYRQNIDQIRQQVHGKFRQAAEQALAGAQREYTRNRQLIDQAKQDLVRHQQYTDQFPDQHPGKKVLASHGAQFQQGIARHEASLDQLWGEIQQMHKSAPEAPEPWRGWSHDTQKTQGSGEDREARRQEREAMTKTAQQTRWLASRGLEVPEGDARDPQHQKTVADLHAQESARYLAERQQLRARREQQLQGRPAAARPTAQPAATEPTDAAGWLAHVDQAVHRATAPAQRDAAERNIALRNWRADYPALQPKGNPAFLDYLERAKPIAHEALQRRAHETLGAAEQWFKAQGQEPPADLARHRDRLQGVQQRRSLAGVADAVPVAVGPGGERKPITEASLARQEARKTEPALPPKERSKSKTQVANELNAANAAEYGWTPKQYHEEAARFWQDRVDRATALEKTRRAIGLTLQQRKAASQGADEDAVRGLDTLTSIAGEHGLPDMTEDQLHQLATRGPIEIPGPHQDEWHEQFADHLRQRGIVTHRERQEAVAQEPDETPEPDHGFSEQEMEEMRQEAFETGQSIEDVMDQRREQLADSTPFSARRAPDLRADLYSALWWATTRA